MPMTLEQLVAHHAQYRPQQLALVFEDERLTWQQFNDRVKVFAGALTKCGVRQGDKVATVLPNSLELLTMYWAVTSIGAVVVPLSPLLQSSAVANLLKDAQVSMAMVIDRAFLELSPLLAELGNIQFVIVGEQSETVGASGIVQWLENSTTEIKPITIAADDPFNIVYSSGTTGLPKGIVHSHLTRALYATYFATAFRISPESVVLHTGSIVFNGAFVTLMPSFYLGCSYILQAAFHADEIIETIKREQVTHVMMVPSQIIALLERPLCSKAALQSLEMVLTLGAPLQQQHKERLERLIPGRFYELYGLTEGFVTILDKQDFFAKPGSVGRPPMCSGMRIVNEEGGDVPQGEIGEITGYSPLLMSGYYNRPDLTQQAIRNGWLHTGDLGYVDEDGYLYLSGRKKELIISGGVNVYPVDIEAVIEHHENVVESAVFGVESEKWGETPVAAVILRNHNSYDAAERLQQWINQRVEARFQRVQDVFIVDAFPRNAAGKTLKDELKAMYLSKEG